MIKNFLFVFCFGVNFSNYYVSLMDTIAGINEKDIHIPLNPRITSNLNLKKVERIYLQYALSGLTENPVCSLPKSKKIALCKRIFQQSDYKDMGIHLNKVAFFANTAMCVKRPVGFKTLLFFLDDIVKETMYPCYGRHSPIRTNYITDNYYDKFYVSTGLTADSVMVYVHEYDDESDWYNVYNYFENFELSELPDVSIDVRQVAAELELNNKIISTSNHEELEYVYIREQDNTTPLGPICELEKSKKAALCQLIFDGNNMYEMLTLNKMAFFAFDPVCSILSLKIRYSKRYKNSELPQHMYPCFGRDRLHIDSNILKGEYVTYFFVSEGPRKNSVFVYHRRQTQTEDGLFYLVELLENIYIDDLKPMNISLNEVINESPTSNAFLEEMKSLVEEKINHELMKVTFKKATAIEELQERLKREIYRFEMNKTGYNIISNLFSEIEFAVLDVIEEEEDQLKQQKYVEMCGELALDDKRCIKDTEKLHGEIKELFEKREKEVKESGGRLGKNEIMIFIKKIRFLLLAENQDTVDRILKIILKIAGKKLMITEEELLGADTSTTKRKEKVQKKKKK